MGSIGGMLGTAGGINGTGISGPGMADIKNPVNQGQINTAYAGVQNSMESQKALLAALQGQNGIGNQSQVYNQMQDVAAGKGPNPAQAQLAQATGANVANQAALMAGQRGASANAGLMARQAAMAGGNAQQQAAGQAASMQAQQSLNAINSAGGMANTQASQQIGQTNSNVGAQQASQANLLNAQAAFNNAQVGAQSSVNNVNGALANTAMQGQQALVGGVMKGASMAAGGMSEGGQVGVDGPRSKVGKHLKMMAEGGTASEFSNFSAAPVSTQGPSDSGGIPLSSSNPGADAISSAFDQKGGGKKAPSPAMGDMAGAGEGAAVSPEMMMMVAAQGGKVPAMLSPGEKYLDPNEAQAVAAGKEDPAKAGKIVPGTPKVKGNSYSNDVVPAELEEGGVVIPNSVMQSKDPVRGAAEFVRKSLSKKGKK